MCFQNDSIIKIMAQGKKAFVMYCDWENVFEMLTNDEAGKLVKHLFAYVNDKKPALDDRILQVAFEPIKQQIKRDQQKYEDTRKKRVEAGRAGGIKSGESRSGSKQGKANEANASNVKQVKANEAVTVTDTVTGIDIYSFDQFWDDYDKKVGKTEASKKWRRLT